MSALRERIGKIDPGVVTGGAPILPLLVLFGLNAVDELDRVAFGVLTPEIKDHFGLSLTGVATLIAVALPVGLLIELPVAYFADRWSRTRMAAGGAVIWAFFCVFTGVAGAMVSLPALYIARGGSALGRTFNVTHNSLLADYYAPDVRASVFYVHRLANTVGHLVALLLAVVLAWVFFWQLPFYLLAVPTLVFVVMALRLQDPIRGYHERVAAGADEDTAQIEEAAPGFSEAFRVLFARESARRLYSSLPFLSASALGTIAAFMSVFYDEVYDVGSGGRAVIFAVTEPGHVAGLVVGAVVMRTIVATNPARAMRLLGLSAIGSAICLAVMALSPMIGFAIGAQLVSAFMGAILVPGVLAVISLAVPARMRTLAFAIGSLSFLLGAPIVLIAGAIGDRWGLRVGILLFVPVYLIGAFLLTSAGAHLAKDIERLNLSARTRAEIRKRRLEGDPQLLVVRGLCVGYEQTQVLFDVDLEVADGEIVALLGTNGSGKSTLLRSLSGLNPPQAGAVIFDGREIGGADPQTIARLGVTQVPGERSIFPSLSVEENLRIAGWMYRDDQEHLDTALAKVHEYFPILAERRATLAGDLSGGEQQMLSLGQAFIARPKLLMIDELSLGLAPTVVRQLLEILPAIHANGTAILLVEQSVNTALELAERAVFIEKGEVRFSGTTAELMGRDDIVRSVYFAAATSQDGHDNGHVPKPIGAPVLRAIELTKRYGGITAVDGVTFELRENEILGLIGPNGAGKTTVFDLVSGFQALNSGRVELFDRDITGWTAHHRARVGLGRSFQNARLWPSLTAAEALAVALERHVDVRAALPAFFHLPPAVDSEAAVRERVEELLAMFELGAFRDKFVSELSTGVRRVVEFAVQLAAGPRVLLLDEPSSGIAQRETDALVPALRRVQDELSCSILLIEHDMSLIRKLTDRVIALDAGRVVAEGTADEVLTDPGVMESYLGTTAPIEV